MPCGRHQAAQHVRVLSNTGQTDHNRSCALAWRATIGLGTITLVVAFGTNMAKAAEQMLSRLLTRGRAGLASTCAAKNALGLQKRIPSSLAAGLEEACELCAVNPVDIAQSAA
jgi:hypothetical protein